MATKKSAAKKTVASEPEVKAPAVKTAAKKTAAVKTVAAAKKTPAKKTVDMQASAKAEPSHHDVSVQAYLLWERDGKKHGHHDHYWKQAEHDLNQS